MTSSTDQPITMTEERSPSDGQSPSRVLIVDDMKANRIMLQDHMSAMGHKTRLAENGEKALAAMEEHMPDLILLDLLMPGMSGLDVLKRLKNEPLWRDIPVVIISAVDELESVVQCIQAGADDYVTKPFNPTLLRARTQALLERKRLHDRDKRVHEELARSHEALVRAERSRDSLVHMIIHDLKNALIGVSGYAGMMRRDLANGRFSQERFLQDLDLLIESADAMNMLVADILDVSKLESDQMPVNLKQVNIAALTQVLEDRTAAVAESEERHLIFEPVDPGCTVRADEKLLERVLMNLLTNGLKYTRRGGTVRLRVERGNGNVRFHVADNGQGIPADYLESVFDKYTQVRNRERGFHYGVGLGLTFCKLAVEAQGGRIWVDSEERKGSTFHVELPTLDT